MIFCTSLKEIKATTEKRKVEGIKGDDGHGVIFINKQEIMRNHCCLNINKTIGQAWRLINNIEPLPTS